MCSSSSLVSSLFVSPPVFIGMTLVKACGGCVRFLFGRVWAKTTVLPTAIDGTFAAIVLSFFHIIDAIEHGPPAVWFLPEIEPVAYFMTTRPRAVGLVARKQCAFRNLCLIDRSHDFIREHPFGRANLKRVIMLTTICVLEERTRPPESPFVVFPARPHHTLTTPGR